MLESSHIQRLMRASPGLFVVLMPSEDFRIVAASVDYLQASQSDESIFGRLLFEVFPDILTNDGYKGADALRASLERVRDRGEADRMRVMRYDLPRPGSVGGELEAHYWSPFNVPVLADDGRVEYIVHRVEEVTMRANDKAVEILDSITDGFFTLDRRWRFDYVNAEAHRILDREVGSLAGKVVWEAYPGLEETPFWRCFHETMESRVKTSFIAYYAPQQRWYEETAFPAPEGIAVYFRNVTSQKQLEAQREALSQLSERLSNAADAAQAGLEGAIAVGTNLGVSRVDYGTVDHASGNLSVAKDWTRRGVQSLSGVTPLRSYGTFLDSLQHGEVVVIPDVRLDPRTADAAAALEEKHARSFVNVPVIERGRLVAILFVNDDKVRSWTTDELAFIQEAAMRTRTAVERATAEEVLRASEERLRRVNEELAESSRMKDEFLATLGHEFRNPLAPISNSLQILGLVSHDPALVAKTRVLMERQVKHMVRLIDDLLDLSRLSRGFFELRLERVSLAAAIGIALDASRQLIENSSHGLEVDLPVEDLVANVDPVRITQVITNLLDNAAKFTPRGGQVQLLLERDGEFAVVRVRDTGVGIRKEMLERVFNMFEQVDQSHAQVRGGLGIRLALVKRLVEAHGGNVIATSGGPGLGSEFRIRLPLAHVEVPEAALTTSPSSLSNSGGLQRILIADDNEDAATSLASLLELDGHEIRVAFNGQQAVEAAIDFRPHVAILDIAMPVLDGLGAARAIRALPFGHEIVLLALSGFGLEGDKQRSADAGFDQHLVKPADLTYLDTLIKAGPRAEQCAAREM